MIHKKKLYVNLVIPKYALSSKNDDDISKNEDDDDLNFIFVRKIS